MKVVQKVKDNRIAFTVFLLMCGLVILLAIIYLLGGILYTRVLLLIELPKYMDQGIGEFVVAVVQWLVGNLLLIVYLIKAVLIVCFFVFEAVQAHGIAAVARRVKNDKYKLLRASLEEINEYHVPGVVITSLFEGGLFFMVFGGPDITLAIVLSFVGTFLMFAFWVLVFAITKIIK